MKMKKFLSSVLCGCVLATTLVVPASAAISTVKDEPIISEDFSGTPEYFKDAMAKDSAASAPLEVVMDGDNAVAPLRLDPYCLFYEEDGVLKGSSFWVQQFKQGNDDRGELWSYGPKRPERWTVEFDVKAINNSNGFAFFVRDGAGSANNRYAAIMFNPDTFVVGTTYTYRISVDEQNAGAGTGMMEAFKKSVRIYREEKDDPSTGRYLVRGESKTASADYMVTNDMVGNACMGFSIASLQGYTWMSTAVTPTTCVYSGNTGLKMYKEAYDAYYQLDNIKVYGESVDINTGANPVMDAEDEYNVICKTSNHTAYGFEEDGNRYVKHFFPGQAYKTIVFGHSMNLDREPSEYFDVYVDLCNAELGAGYRIEPYGPKHPTLNIVTSSVAVILKSSAEDQNQWYTYKIACKDNYDPSKHVNMSILGVWRKPRGSNEEYTLLKNGIDYRTDNPLSSNVENVNGFKFGPWVRDDGWGFGPQFPAVTSMAYYADALENCKAVWYIDNVQVVSQDAIVGNVEKTETGFVAELNVTTNSTATPIVAVYDAETNAFVKAAFANLSATKEKATITCDVDTDGKKVMLFMWENFSTGAPILADGIDITGYLK